MCGWRLGRLLGRRRLFRGFGGLERGGVVSLGSFCCVQGVSVSHIGQARECLCGAVGEIEKVGVAFVDQSTFR